MEDNKEKAIFAAGCFWGVEEAFRILNGVVSTRAGYTGGTLENPGYYDVATGDTGHVESVEITFDPSLISFKDLLNVFWNIHDPTTKDRQGPDIGSQYRSAIFYLGEDQKRIAWKSLEEQEAFGRFGDSIKTEIVPASKFYPAEEHHQKYFAKRCFRN